MRWNNTKLLRATTAITLVLAFSVAAKPAQAQSAITGLDDLAGGSFSSSAYSINSSGTVVVGSSQSVNTEAFIWTLADGMVGLGYLPNSVTLSIAYGISADSSTVVGISSNGDGNNEAFRWTQAGGMVGLGDLAGGNFLSYASGVNADGTVVVGASESVGGQEAFRWTQADGMVGLSELAGGSYFSASQAVNADGSVVVGASDGPNGYEAFRWTQADGMVGLGDLAGGGFNSSAKGISADGTVIVGVATSADGQEAFRWTQADGMVGLGDLAGSIFDSRANGVSADGLVIIGQGYTNAGYEAFRWTQTDGMQSVQDWLGDAGINLPTGWTRLEDVYGVNSDGSVVVGYGYNENTDQEAFIARVSNAGSGIIETAEYGKSLESTGAAVNTVGTQADLHLNGARSTPLLGLVDEGQGMLWTIADLGSRDREGGSGYQALAELGYNYGLKKNLQIGLGLGLTDGQQDLVFDGNLRQDGFYLAPELLWNPQGKLYLSALGYYNDGDINLRRGYDNGGTPDFSNGRTDMKTLALRLRADWKDAFSHGQTKFTPNVSYTYIRTALDGFTESDGGFPVTWEDYTDASNTLRVGLDANHALNRDTTVLGRIEATHRFEDRSDGARGQVIGLSSFETSGSSRKQTWFRAGAGAETALGQGKASFMLNLSTEGEDKPDAWLSAGYRIRF